MMTGTLRAEMIGNKGTFYSAEKETKRAGVDNVKTLFPNEGLKCL